MSNKDRIITVDGVGYNLDTGKSVGTSQKSSKPADSKASPSKSTNLLDLRHFAPEPDGAAEIRDDVVDEKTVKPKVDVVAKDSLAVAGDDSIDSKSISQSREPSRDHLHSSAPSTGKRKVKSGFFNKVFILPFTERVDRYVVQGFLLSTMISPYFWFLALAPGIVVKLLSSQKYAINDLLFQLRSVLAPANYYKLTILSGVFLALCLVSLLVSYLVRIVARATKLRAIDHRSVSPRLLYRQAMNKSLRSLVNWLLNATAFCLVLSALGMLTRWLILSNQSIVTSWLSTLLSIASIVVLLVLMIYMMIWQISQTMIAATDKNIWSVQGHSYRLVFGSLPKNITSAILLWVVSLVVVFLLGLVGWAEVTYLSSTPYLYMKIGIFVLGAILILAILVCFRIWKNMLLARLYHVLATIRGKVAMSGYLSLEKPAKTGLAPFLIVSIAVSIILLGYSYAAYSYKGVATNQMERVHSRIPASLEIKIPKLIK